MIITEERFYDTDSSDEVLTEIIKTLIPNNLRSKISSKKNRQLMLEKYGKDAFLLPNQLKFPVVNPDTGKYECSLIYAARIRAKQYAGVKPGYREIANKAEELYKSNKCNIKLNIQINNESEKLYDIDFINLIEVLY